MQNIIRHRSVPTVVLAILGLIAPAVHGATTLQFNLPAQSLAKSLQAVGSQTNLNILFDPPLVAGRHAPALNAKLTADEALARILSGSGLTHQFLNDSTVVLAPLRSSQSPAAATTSDAAQIADLQLARTEENESRRLERFVTSRSNQSIQGSHSSSNFPIISDPLQGGKRVNAQVFGIDRPTQAR